MTKPIIRGLVCALVCACGASSPASLREGRAPALSAAPSVLFLGNSLVATQASNGDDMPAVLSRFAASRGRALSVNAAIDLGHTLQESWDASIPQPYLALAGPYDVIVYQEYSTLALTNADIFFKTALTTYQPSIQKALKPGGQMMLFENWALQDPSPFSTRAQALASLHASYAQLSTALSTANQIVHFASAWEAVFATRPQSFLFQPDGKHPTDAGVYLDACLMYAMLFGESPVGMPSVFLSSQDAAFLQGIAAGFVPVAQGVPDAGTADAGTVADAGVADAGTADAGVADAGVASGDAGVTPPPPATDAGVADAGNPVFDAGAAEDPVRPPVLPAAASGGCSSGGGTLLPVFALLLFLLCDHRRRSRSFSR